MGDNVDLTNSRQCLEERNIRQVFFRRQNGQSVYFGGGDGTLVLIIKSRRWTLGLTLRSLKRVKLLEYKC